jgi:hypothetical protein
MAANWRIMPFGARQGSSPIDYPPIDELLALLSGLLATQAT